jgi:putative restriction endonuclease
MLDYRHQIVLEKTARDCGFEIVVSKSDDGILFASSLAPDQVFLGAKDAAFFARVGASAIVAELEANFLPGRLGYHSDGGSICASSTLLLHHLIERIFELSTSIPTRPLDVFLEQTARLPKTTEVERLVIQRVGQDIFRDALHRYWTGKCAVTGIPDRPLLRASHIHPWSDCETDGERLDSYNGILLVADLDAAFDAALITFDENGRPVFGSRLSTEGKVALSARFGDRIVSFTDRHQKYLQRHRARFAKLNA